jgi:hypothetical protein
MRLECLFPETAIMAEKCPKEHGCSFFNIVLNKESESGLYASTERAIAPLDSETLRIRAFAGPG